ncbi:MAG: M56 family metallopeptidase [Bacteroidia bacterium]|nr:M56 family metallopeptidase [Bacteroidia bacterium]
MNFPNNMMVNVLTEALGWTLLHSLWQGLIVVVALAIFLTLMKGRSPESRYFLSLLALGVLFTWIVATFLTQYGNFYNQQISMEYEETWAADFSEEMYIEMAEISSADYQLWEFSQRMRPYMPWISVIWAAGFMFFTLRWAGGLYHVHQLRSNGVRPVEYDWKLKVNKLAEKVGLNRSITLYESFRVSVPMVIGHLKPVILLPVGMLNGISPAQLEAVIVHELAHIRRNDFLINMLISMVESLLFYHPAYWWISSQIQTEREHCCDDLAVKYCGDPLSYARVLADLEENRLSNLRLAMGLSGQKKYLLRRIRRIVVPEATEAQLQGKSVFGLILVIVLTAVAGLSPQTVRPFAQNIAQELEDFPLVAAIPSVPGMIGYPEFYASIDTPPPAVAPPAEPEGGWGEMPEMPEMPEFPEFPEFPENFFSSELPDSAAMKAFRESMLEFQEQQEEWSQEVGEYWREYAEKLSMQARFYADVSREQSLANALEMLEHEKMLGSKEHREAFEEARRQLAESRNQLHEEDFQRKEEEILRRHEEALEREMEALERAREMQEHQREMQELSRERMREMEERIRQEHHDRIQEQQEHMREQQQHMREQQEHVREQMREVEEQVRAERERYKGMSSNLKSELLRDGLILSADEKVKIRVQDGELKINGKKLSGDQNRKYRAILRKFGFDADEDGSLQFDF